MHLNSSERNIYGECLLLYSADEFKAHNGDNWQTDILYSVLKWEYIFRMSRRKTYEWKFECLKEMSMLEWVQSFRETIDNYHAML